MKLDNHLIGGVCIGVVIGLHYGTALSAYTPIFFVLGLLYLMRFIKVK